MYAAIIFSIILQGYRFPVSFGCVCAFKTNQLYVIEKNLASVIKRALFLKAFMQGSSAISSEQHNTFFQYSIVMETLYVASD